MNLFNKKILNQRIASYSFPKGEKAELISKLIIGWQKSLKDSDLSKTKEKSVQGKFLNVFFEQILGYEDKTGGKEQWTLIAEPKTEVDAQSADGSIGFFTKEVNTTVGVIELKDAKTSLDKKQSGREKGYSPIEQAYLYATKFDRCKWIIVSNFREIRLYNKSRSEQFYEKFDILELHKEDEFKKFYYLLNIESLISTNGESSIDDLAKKSEDTEEDISKKFYLDYKNGRDKLFKHLAEFNPEVEKKSLFEKSQKILDRVVFILFCEDTANLLPKSILKDTYNLGIKSRDRSDQRVWREMKNLFIDIDEGRNDIDPKINGYNGGLFKSDDVLDNLVIKDDIWQSLIKLTDYDFETDLNVNILGHIFEQSIGDIESIKSEIEGLEVEKKKTKRKKDGIFYTPEYITKYIVESSVGRYLSEHPEKLETIKILDPACGSGSMLNQAHSYLLNEYKVRHEQHILEKEEKGEAITLFDYNPAEANRAILLNNLYGVDLNDESAEITKLSLWLKTARKDEPLQNLDGNIKVGNSLISDSTVDSIKAFDWKKEFSEITSSGGFDVIIGNPPYVRNELIPQAHKDYYSKNYKNTYSGKSDLYVYFFEKFVDLLKDGGYGAMIVSSKYTKTKYGKLLIEFLENNTKILEFIDFKDSEVFEGITAYPSVIVFQKAKPVNNNTNVAVLDKNTAIVGDLKSILSMSDQSIDQAELFNFLGTWNGNNSKGLHELFKKLIPQNSSYNQVFKIPQVGIKTGYNEAYILDSTNGFKSNDPHIKEYIVGKDVKRYSPIISKKYIIFPYNKIGENQLELAKESDLSIEIQNHLNANRTKLENRAVIKEGLNTGKKIWYEYQQIRLNFNYSSYIVYPDISNGVNFTLAKDIFYDMTCFGIDSQDMNLLGLLNSKFVHAYLESLTVKARGGYLRLKSQYINQIPIPNSYEELNISENVKKIMEKRMTLLDNYKNLIELVNANYKKQVSIPITTFLNLGSNQLLSIFEDWNLPIEKQEELQKWLKNKQVELFILQDDIKKLEEDINQNIFSLYGLTDEEKSIIETSIAN